MFSIIIIIFSSFIVRLTTISQDPLEVQYNSFGLSESIVCLLILIFSIIHLGEIKRNVILKNNFLPLLIAYLIRIILIFLDLYCRDIIHLPNSGADSERFYGMAKIIASGTNIKYMIFVTCIGHLYKIIGVSRLYLQFLLMLCSMITLYVIILILNKLDLNIKIQNQTIIIIGCLPNFAILSSIFLRESIVTMFISLSILFFIYWLYEKKEIYLGVAVIFILCASAIHTGAMALLAGFISVRYLYVKKYNRFEINIRNIFPVIIFIFAFIWLYHNHSETFFTKIQDIETIEDISQNIESGGSSYAQYVGASSGISGILIYSLPRMFFFMFSPLPWQWRGIPDIIAFVFSSLFYMYIIFSTLQKLYQICKSQTKSNNIHLIVLIALSIIAIFSSFVFGWGCNNTGTATRHRDKMMCIYAVMLGININYKNKKM